MDYCVFTDKNSYGTIVVFSIITYKKTPSGGTIVEDVLYTRAQPGEVEPVPEMFIPHTSIRVVNEQHLILYLFTASKGLGYINAIY